MANKLWGGRFKESPDAFLQELNASISFDRKLYKQDIKGSLVHAEMLERIGVLTSQEAKRIREGLITIQNEIESNNFVFDNALEDIHMHIEHRLKELIGETAGKLHTARSRNDQVATSMKLWVRTAIDGLIDNLTLLQKTFATKALDFHDCIMPGFTHLQNAQPVTLGHHLLAYVEMLARDVSRLNDSRKRLNYCPLGAAALGGTSYPIDRHYVSKALGFDQPTNNSLDSVSDRDFVIEFLSNLSMLILHLTRFAEEVVLWTSAQFQFISLPDSLTTGSSIMPQKRNPDIAELIRGKSGRIIGALVGILTMMKALPLAYSKDMQEDKEGVFDAVENVERCIIATQHIVSNFEPNRDAMREAAERDYSTATDLADWLVQSKNFAFRDAHHIAGRLVALAFAQHKPLSELSLEEMQSIEPSLNEEVYSLLSADASVRRKASYGSTHPESVRAQAERWVKLLDTAKA